MKTVLKLLTAGAVLMLGLSAGNSALRSAPGKPGARVAQVEAGGATIYLPAIRRDFLPPIDLGISRVEVIQGTTMSNAYEVHIANRAATLRVFASFASIDGSTSVGNISALLTCNPGNVQVSAGPITVFQAPSEGNLSHTFNFNLPAGCLAMGASYNIQMDSANALVESNESNNRYPTAGDQSFNYVSSAALNVVIVPVQYKGFTPPTANLDYLTWMPIKVFPMSQINYSLWPGGVYNFNGDLRTGSGWSQLLGEIDLLNPYSSNTTLYLGVVDFISSDGCGGGCIAGIGYIGFPSSVTWAGWTPGDNSASPVATHEMGHNLGRYHPNCGGPSGVDPNYPYGSVGNTIIGQWGLDVATGTLYDPNAYRDYMSYCDPQWTSDYTYKGIADAWTVMAAQAGAPKADALLINGWFDEQDHVQLGPLMQQTVAAPTDLSGSHRVELLDARGQVLVSQPFNPVLIASDSKQTKAYSRGFRVALPVVEGATTFRIYEGEAVVFERAVEGAAPKLKVVDSTLASEGAVVRWQLTAGAADTVYHVRFSPDGGQTWIVLALNTTTPSLTVPASLLDKATHPIVEVQASDGVRVTALTIELK